MRGTARRATLGGRTATAAGEVAAHLLGQGSGPGVRGRASDDGNQGLHAPAFLGAEAMRGALTECSEGLNTVLDNHGEWGLQRTKSYLMQLQAVVSAAVVLADKASKP